MKKMLLPIFTIFLMSTLAPAQEFDLQAFLNTAFEDPMVVNVYDQRDFLQSSDLRTPNINEVEIRTRSEGLNTSLDDVRFRLTLTNFGEIREGGRYNDLLIESYALEYNVRIHLALVYRYQLVLDYLKIISEIEIIEQQKLNTEDQISVEKANILNGNGSVSDLANMESDYTNLMIRESNLKNQLTIQVGNILSYYTFDGPVSIPAESVINPVFIGEIINDMQLAILNPTLVLKEQEIQLGLQETQLEIKESNGDFGYFQAEYERNRGQSYRENLGYQLGFNIPITNPDKAKIQQQKLKNLKEQQSLDYMLAKHENEMDILEKELLELISQYQFLEEQYLEMVSRNTSLRGKYLKIESALKMQENELRLKKALANLNQEIMDSYLEWLDKSGTISQDPLKNYLLSNTPTLSEQGN